MFAILDVADVCVIHFSLMPKTFGLELSNFNPPNWKSKVLVMHSPSHYLCDDSCIMATAGHSDHIDEHTFTLAQNRR